jgi:hypothetical protein
MPEAEGGGIFVSYRRQESGDFAGRLYDRLTDRFGEGQVFIDVDAIEPGVDFAEEISRAVSACQVLLAVIGPNWLTATDERGRRRLDDPDDIVRLEVEAALARDVRVIPILTGGAVMPGRHDLPESLASLARRNALVIRHESFRSDAIRLVTAIERVLTAASLRQQQGPRPPTDSERVSEAPKPGTEGPDPAAGRAGRSRYRTDDIVELLTAIGTEMSISDVISALHDAGRPNETYDNVAADLAYLAEPARGRIARIRRGVYAAIPDPQSEPDRIVIRLTQGNLNNNHVYLSRHLDFFPPDAIGAANKRSGKGTLLKLRFEGLPGAAETDIASDKKIFRLRGRRWQEFFERHDLRPGDKIAIERISAFEYRVVPEIIRPGGNSPDESPEPAPKDAQQQAGEVAVEARHTPIRQAPEAPLQLPSPGAASEIDSDFSEPEAKERLTLRHEASVSAIAFSADGRVIATGSKDNTAKVWDAITGAERISLKHTGPVTEVIFNRSATRLATKCDDGSARVWDLTSKLVIARFRNAQGASVIAFSPDGSQLAIGGSDGVVFRDVRSDLVRRRAHGQRHVSALAFSPDGRMLAVGAVGSFWVEDLDPDHPSQKGSISIGSAVFSDISFSSDGIRVAAAGNSGGAVFQDLTESKGPSPIDDMLPRHPASCVGLNADGSVLAISDPDGLVLLTDVATRWEIIRIPHERGVDAIAFTPDSTARLATASEDGVVRVWDIKRGPGRSLVTDHDGD